MYSLGWSLTLMTIPSWNYQAAWLCPALGNHVPSCEESLVPLWGKVGMRS